MSSKARLIVFGLVIFALALAACQPAATQAPAAATQAPAAATQAPAAAAKKVAVLFPGVVSDQSWNQFGFEGLKQA